MFHLGSFLTQTHTQVAHVHSSCTTIPSPGLSQSSPFLSLDSPSQDPLPEIPSFTRTLWFFPCLVVLLLYLQTPPSPGTSLSPSPPLEFGAYVVFDSNSPFVFALVNHLKGVSRFLSTSCPSIPLLRFTHGTSVLPSPEDFW